MINGQTVQQQQVQNLYLSVQLNVNNPHFLIMQGRITKVLNMKPPEILSMIEEAAGTRMFETKKQAALKTIEKKQAKVEEITNVVNSEIMPTLDKLRSDRQNYATWNANNQDIDRLTRLLVAFDYSVALARVNGSDNERAEMEREMNKLNKEQEDAANDINACDAEINKLLATRNGPLDTQLVKQKKAADELSKDLVKADSLWKNTQETLASERSLLQSLNKQIQQCNETIATKTTDLAAANESFAKKETEASVAENAMVEMREKFQKACAGVGDESNAELLSLPEQVRTWEQCGRECQSQLQQIALKSEHVKASLKEATKDMKAQQSSVSGLVAEAEQLKKSVAKLEAELSQLQSSSVSPSEERDMRKKAEKLNADIQTLNDSYNRLQASVSAKLAFEYNDPEKGFNRNRVKGLVAKLITVTDKRACTALEIAAAGKLYQVVVDNEQTSKLLIEKGNLQKRVTIVPLTKISANVVDANKMQQAKQIARQNGGTAQLGLELVGYDEEVRRAIEYTFGNFIVCDTADVAKAITLNKALGIRTVTHDGDVFENNGTLSGGSNNKMGQLLSAITDLAEINEKLQSNRNELQQLQSSLKQLDTTGTRVRELSEELDLKKHALKICEDKMGSTSYAQAAERVKTLETEMAQYTKETDALEEKYKKSQEELKKLKNSEKNVQKQREAAMKDVEKQIKESQKVANKLKSELAAARHARDLVVGELENAKKELATLTEQVGVTQKSVQKLTEEVEIMGKKVSKL